VLFVKMQFIWGNMRTATAVVVNAPGEVRTAKIKIIKL